MCVGGQWQRKGERGSETSGGRSLSSKKEQIIKIISCTYLSPVSISNVAKLTANALDRGITLRVLAKLQAKFHL